MLACTVVLGRWVAAASACPAASSNVAVEHASCKSAAAVRAHPNDYMDCGLTQLPADRNAYIVCGLVQVPAEYNVYL